MFRKKYSSLILQSILLAVFFCGAAKGAGELDSGFSASAFGGLAFNGTINAVKVQPDGKILVGGHFTEANGFAATAIARLNADGTTDTSFRSPDFYSFQGIGREVWAIALQPDGKILVGGDLVGADNVPKRGLVRLNADGSLDTSFNSYELPTSSIVFDIEVQTDNKILVGGLVCGIFRLNANGTFDNSFTPSLNGTGSSNGVEDLDIQPDGKIVVVGRNLMLRVTDTGALDGSFNNSNSFSGGTITTVRVRTDGKILVGGSFQTINAATHRRLRLFNSDGSLDSAFSPQGPDSEVKDIFLKADGKIIIGGAFVNYNSTPRLRVAQINADGSLDTSVQFNITGAIGTVNDVELQTDGKLLVGLLNGVSTFVRFNADGTNDSGFAPLITRDATVNKILPQPDGKVLVLGEFLYANGVQRNYLARFNANGSLDTSFVPPTTGTLSFALQSDGKILVGGFSSLKRLNPNGSEDTSFAVPSNAVVYDIVPLANGQILYGGSFGSIGGVVRLNANGSVDSTFTSPQFNSRIQKLLWQSDGKLLIGGEFTFPRNAIARLSADGSLDTTFVGEANAPVYALDLQADGKIIVGGQFTALNSSVNQVSIGRLNSNGTLDTGFVQSTNSVVRTVKVQTDGKILIGGTMSAVGGAPHNGLARLNSNGTIDSSFNTFANASVRDIQLQTDGKILLGGTFTKINGLSAVRVARLLNPTARTLFDFDGDSRADISVFRPSENKWYISRSSDGQITQTIFAVNGDIPAQADFDGDGKTDIAVFRPSTGDWWYISSIDGGQKLTHWGASGDIPRPSDFDGDGKADFIVYRAAENNWYRLGSTGAVSIINFGVAGDKPVTGDFDGDGKSDVAIYRPSTGDWWYAASSAGGQFRATRWGISTDIPAPADFDGDGKTDFAVYRPSTGVWYIYNSSNGAPTIMNFGLTEDKPVPADYDGDGRADVAVFRPSTGVWYLMRSTAGFTALQFGVSTDIPTPNAFVP